MDDSYVEITKYTGSETEVVIPEEIDGYKVEVIGADAFYFCNSLTSITIPNGVTSIGNYAFWYCNGLNGITIPAGVISIGNYAFGHCSGLTSIKVESNNSVYDSRNNCNAIIKTDNNELIIGCSNTTIPNSVTSIGDYAFMDCSGLTSITIPNNVTSIGYEAFRDCSGLISITIPDSVTSIGGAAFRGCSGLTNITIPNSVTNIVTYAFMNCSGLMSLTIPDSVTNIGFGAFQHCSGLTSITIPDSVKNIGYCAFGGTSLKEITIPNSVINIEDSAFSSCVNLTSIKVESNNSVYDSRNNCNAIIKTDNNELIIGCSNTTIPNSVTSIGHSAFYGCSGLTSITIPDSVTSVGDRAFRWCSGLTSITIPNSVTSIGDYTFSDCSSLTSITIPDSVTSIGNGAFSCCKNLIITCEENSYAHQYAKDNNIKYELTGSTGKKANSITCSKTYKKNMSTNAQSFKLDVKSAGGTIKYKSNNSKVKVTGSGKVTIAKNFVGTAVITVTAGDCDYEKVTKKITIKILPTSTKITSAKSNAKGKITVKWGKVSNVTGYQLQYSTNASFKTGVKTLLNKKASTTGKVITKLEKGNTYYLRIRTYKKVSGKNVYSAWSAKKKVKIKK